MRHQISALLLFLLFYFSLGLRDSYIDGHAKNSSCEMGSCYPATGNLLIGREKMLSATSTCGLHGKERYCIVSHLEPKKCFTCDSRPGRENDPMLSHRIENIVYSKFPGSNTPSWWQSENGKEHVSIRLDLEAEFHFTHLIMKFRTFRPRAMLIERSSDKGKTWKVYRYFAENCDEAFPHIPKPPQRQLTDVICESRYSTAEPSNLGEVILRVISPSLQGAYRDPYSPQLQDLLKMTNLRINFTKLQTLGDDLVDNRDEIKEKYYYAVKEMTVRGSCWCYGHARSCIPVEGVEDRTDMVHGKCNCTHNTKGLNCEECADAYNDVPWAPAIGRQANACRACNCNNHSNKCKFNEEVYIKSGRVSGGVCQNCSHNTKGKNCEECADYYYLDSNRVISDPDACIPCRCNLDGSRDGGLCDSKTDIANGLESGRCHCKANVHGKYCDMCKPGYWNFDPNNPDGCQECTCDTRGTVNGTNVCDVFTGECTCKPKVTGSDCNQCLPQHWGLSMNTNGCEPCACAIGGSLYPDCDVITGECKCRPNIVGRQCDKPNHGFYVPTPGRVYEAEFAECKQGDCRIEIREPRRDQPTPWTGSGFMRVYDHTTLEFTIDNINKTNDYQIVIRYETQPGDYTTAEILLIRPDGDSIDPRDICANRRPQDDESTIDLPSDSIFTEAQTVCLQGDKNYKVRIQFRTDGNNQVDSPTASILIDSIVLIPSIESLPFFKDTHPGELKRREYENLRCKEALYSPWTTTFDPKCEEYHYSVGVTVFDGASECKCDPTGSVSSLCDPQGGNCQCKHNVVGRKCDNCAPGTYNFGPQGCKDCDCDSVGACDNICNVKTGQCTCKNGTYGRSCGECEPGQWNFPQCQPCDCNGHAHICNSFTGECINCKDSTTGHSCERCKEGFFGDPKIGSGIQCKPCLCPNTVESGHSFAPTCTLNLSTEDVVCHCQEGYTGPRCDACDENFYGSPEEPGGSCKPCQCSDNIDLSQPGNCDRQTGACLKCLHNTAGAHCETCKPGFFGDALLQTCASCDCDLLGTNHTAGPCDPVTGQCTCLPNVEGRTCNQCKPNFWKIGLGVGCESCNCDKKGSTSELCNPYNGECVCKEGFGGRQCNSCKAYFYGDPNVECFPCVCNELGSLNFKCNQDNGTCECRPGIGGDHCDMCDRGWFGTFPTCTKCGECFYNWDETIDSLKQKTNDVIKSAGKIKQTGATGAYNSDFKTMTDNISFVKNVLSSTKENNVSLTNLNQDIDLFRTMLNNSLDKLNSQSEKVHTVLTTISDAKYTLKSVHRKVMDLKDVAKQLNDNATQLQEKDLKGALNLTRAAGSTSIEVSKIEATTKKLLYDVDRNCRRTEKFLNLENDTFSDTEQKNERRRDELEFQLSQLEKQIPDLNNKICDGTTSTVDHCDNLCGGAGCSRCGGISCKMGAVGKASAGLEFAKDTEKNINKHLKDAEITFRMIDKARMETENANKAANKAYNEAFQIKTDFEDLVVKISKVADGMENYVKTPAADPQDIQRVAAEVLSASIPYEPDKIRNLTKHINDKIASLKNINKIVDETKDDQAKANEYKQKAENKMNEAAEVEKKAGKLVHSVTATLESQGNVTQVIKQANDSIVIIKKDLAQITSEVDDAEQKADDTHKDVKSLQAKLKKLQTRVLMNEQNAKSLSAEGKRVSDQVKIASSDADELILKYNRVNEDLQNKNFVYEVSKSRAQKLLERAQTLSGSAKAKLKELKDFTSLYEDQEKLLTDFALEIQSLLNTMNQANEYIHIKAENYRTCYG